MRIVFERHMLGAPSADAVAEHRCVRTDGHIRCRYNAHVEPEAGETGDDEQDGLDEPRPDDSPGS